jgi:hypothetical protein
MLSKCRCFSSKYMSAVPVELTLTSRDLCEAIRISNHAAINVILRNSIWKAMKTTAKFGGRPSSWIDNYLIGSI